MVSKEEIESLAGLARLKLTEQEVAALQKDISNILEYVGQVSAVSLDAKKEAPYLRNVLREDLERGEGDLLAHKRDAILAQLPKEEGGYNVVRKIIQKDE